MPPKSSTHKDAHYTADPRVHVGHVHLKVADLERALSFYAGVLGLEVTQRLGDSAAFLSAGGYHHHIALNTWESLGGSPPPPGTTGLYHTAILYPTRTALADALRRVLHAHIPLEGAADHGVSQSIYLRDPDDNGVELYCDKPKDQWPRMPDGKLAMYTRPLDLTKLLSEASAEVPSAPAPATCKPLVTLNEIEGLARCFPAPQHQTSCHPEGNLSRACARQMSRSTPR
jgi:catechol 2,3-dioxygenase